MGVAHGTPELYSVFPEAEYLLIEPLKHFEGALKSIVKKYNGTYLLAAAGSSEGEVLFNIHNNHMDGSSIYKETMGAQADGYEVKVPMVMIDNVIKDKDYESPILIKIDVQGAELDALDGAQDTLKETEVVVLEVSLFEFMKGAPQFSEAIAYMKQRGFVAYDIIQGWNRPLDNALGQVDVVFVQDTGMFRKDHSFSTLEQMSALFPKN